MPVKLVGKKVSFAGKTLWEILGNLKNFGVGRLVIKSHFKNYPEVSYYKIVKVQPINHPKNEYFCREVMVWAEHVFRGTKYPELVRMHRATIYPKYQLIPKGDEHLYLNAPHVNRVTHISTKIEWPPLMKMIFSKKTSSTLSPLETVIKYGPNSVAVLSSESEKVLPLVRSNFHNEFSVEELTKRLNDLKTKTASLIEKSE